MKRLRQAFLIAASAAALGCESDKTVIGVTTGETIHLTQAQASALVSYMTSFASTDPTLAALGDSARFVLKAGAEARQIDVATDLGDGPYWAVSMQRSHAGAGTSPQSWSTFHVIAFNEPNNVSRFIVLGGYSSVSGLTPPNSVTGSIGSSATSSLTAHFFSTSGTQVSAWHANAGTVSMTATPTSEACANFTATNMSCVKSSMSLSFNITGSVPGNGTTGQRTGSTATAQTVPGVRLAF